MSTSDATFDPDAAASADAGIFGLPHQPAEAAVVLVPVPFDATTSYRPGTADGPRSILAASHQVDLHDHETGEPWAAGIAMLPEPAEIRAWSAAARQAAEPVMHDPEVADAARRVAEVDAWCERLNRRLEAETLDWLDAGKIVGIVGGDHGTTFGAIAAHARRYPGLGILHIDAHADLRAAYQGFTWSHASIMENVMRRLPEVSRLVQVGVRDFCAEEAERIVDSAGRIRTWFDADLARGRFEGATWGEQVAAMVDALPHQVYVSFDIDGLSPDLCPSTGTPVPGGLGFHEASYLIGAVTRSGRRIVGFELVEVAPGPAGDEWDANVGARMLYKLIGWALRSRASAG